MEFIGQRRAGARQCEDTAAPREEEWNAHRPARCRAFAARTEHNLKGTRPFNFADFGSGSANEKGTLTFLSGERPLIPPPSLYLGPLTRGVGGLHSNMRPCACSHSWPDTVGSSGVAASARPKK